MIARVSLAPGAATPFGGGRAPAFAPLRPSLAPRLRLACASLADDSNASEQRVLRSSDLELKLALRLLTTIFALMHLSFRSHVAADALNWPHTRIEMRNE